MLWCKCPGNAWSGTWHHNALCPNLPARMAGCCSANQQHPPAQPPPHRLTPCLQQQHRAGFTREVSSATQRGRLVAVQNCCRDVLLETHKCSQSSAHPPSSAALPLLSILPTLHGPQMPACLPRGVSALTAARRGGHAPARAVAGRAPFHRPIGAVACRRFGWQKGDTGVGHAKITTEVMLK